MLILLALTLIFGRDALPEWLQDKVAALEGILCALAGPFQRMFGGSF